MRHRLTIGSQEYDLVCGAEPTDQVIVVPEGLFCGLSRPKPHAWKEAIATGMAER